MKRTKFSEQQIAFILRQAKAVGAAGGPLPPSGLVGR